MPFLIFAVALAVRLIHIFQIKPSPFFDVLLGDANGYDAWAQRLAGGDWVGGEVFYQAPLYPYFLGAIYAIFGRDLLIVRICQAVVGSASCVLIGLAGQRLFSRGAGMAAGLALALYAPAIFFDGLLQKSVLDMFFVCLSLWLVAKISTGRLRQGYGAQGAGTRASWVALGVAMGGLALTRENALVFIAVIVAWILWDSVDVRTAGASAPAVAGRGLKASPAKRLFYLSAGLAIVLLPVAARNYSVGGGFYLTTSQFGSNLYIGNNPGADGTYASIRFGRGAPEFERQDATEVAEQALGRTLTPAEVSRYWTGRAFDFIATQPDAWVKLTARKILLLFNRSEMLDTESQESYAEWSWPLRILGGVGHFGVLVPIAVLGVIATRKKVPAVVLAMGAAYAASVVMFFVFARYRYPLVPFLVLFAVAGIAAMPRAWLSWPATTRRRAGAAVLATVIFTNWPVLSGDLMRAITENNLATALQAQGRLDEALAHYQRALAFRPDYAPAHNNMGTALKSLGRIDEAVASYRRALELQPDYPSAHFNLANVQLAKGEASDAVEQFRKALEREPESVEAHTNLAAALESSGDRAGAIAEFRKALEYSQRSSRSHRNLGNALANSGDVKGGLEHLSEAVRLDPSDTEARYDLGSLLLELEQFPQAVLQFEAALKIKADSPETMNNLGIALASQGKIREALAHFERAVAIKPDFAGARANRDQARAALSRRP